MPLACIGLGLYLCQTSYARLLGSLVAISSNLMPVGSLSSTGGGGTSNVVCN